MRVEKIARRGLGAAAVMAGVVLAGCGGPTGSVAAGDSDPGNKIGNLLAFRTSTVPPLPSQAGPRIDCPIVQVEPGMAAYRVGGDSNQSVRYQISIGDVSRDCSMANGQLLVRVGVETRVVTGPAGGPGSYTAPLTISLRRTGDEAVLASKTYQVGGAVGSTGTALTTLIADPLAAPYINERAADDYEVVLAMGQGGRALRSHSRRRGRR